ncbi:MAG TPA: ATP-binding protein, partial [Kofleriaceae bacterium]|nr:ATP-binding protein [Kofleriaceae bacterium]
EIEERRRAEATLRAVQEQLLQAQKLEAIGRLAGGVAHDFNNLLTVVLSYVHLLLPAFPQGDPRRHYLDEVKRAGERGAALTRQLLAFSRQQVMARKVIDPAQILREMDTLIRKLAGKRVEVDVAIADDVGNIKADASSIEQVIMNLVVNARDAMPEGGRLSIELRNVDLDAVGAHEQLGDLRGSHVMLAVGDTGIGMDRETQQRIFEPFFTTKPRGKGTGLGLPTVFGIVTQAGGAISVESEPGRGSLFRVYLPLTREALEPAVPRSPVRSLRGTETILVADDDEQLRQVVRQTLEAQGYTVLVAADGPEAIALCERSAGPIHLLLTDLVMPHMSGRELAGRLASIRPAMKVLYMSGYAEVVTASHDLGATHAALLQKPITPESLLRKLREVLGGT